MLQKITIIMLALTFLSSCTLASEKEVAHYTKGTTNIIEQFTVDDKGIQKKITSNNDILQDIIVKIPPGAFDRETQVSVGLNDGTLKLMEGQASIVPYRQKGTHIEILRVYHQLTTG